MKKWSLFIMLPVLLILFAPVLAHDPLIEKEDWGDFEQPLQVTDPAVSYAFYGYLDNNDIDVFKYDFAKADEPLHVQLLTPVCGDHYAEFYPQFLVVAPKDMVKEPVNITLPFDLPTDLAIFYSTIAPEEPDDEEEPAKPLDLPPRATFVEPIGGTEFYDAPTVDLKIPVAGTYYVVVYYNDGITGDYVLATGTKEQFDSPVSQTLANVAEIKSGAWLHRHCDLPLGDPNAIIEPQPQN